MKRSSGKEQPSHGGKFSGEDLWQWFRREMCSGINAGIMLLAPDEQIYNRMCAEVGDADHPEHVGTYGPEQDYLSRFYCVFARGAWSHIHAKYNYQLMLPDDYVSSEHKALRITEDVVVAHYSGPRVKPWELERNTPLNIPGVQRLLEDDSVKDVYNRNNDPSAQRRGPPKERIMDGVLIVYKDNGWSLPEPVQAVMFEWVTALRNVTSELAESGDFVLEVIAEAEAENKLRAEAECQ